MIKLTKIALRVADFSRLHAIAEKLRASLAGEPRLGDSPAFIFLMIQHGFMFNSRKTVLNR